MNTQAGEEQKAKITLNLDEFDIDTYDFKPITKGLGFHDPLEKSKRVQASPNRSAKVSTQTRTSRSPVSHLQNTPSTVSDPSLVSGIEALYGNRPAEQVVKAKETQRINSKTKTPLKSASYLEASGAFVIDLLVVTLINTLLFISFYGLAFRELSLSGIQGFVYQSLPYFMTLLALIFISYFSLLEPMETIGKRLWGIRTVLVGSKKPITIKLSFVRSLIALLSLPLLLFPLIFDFQGKLSDSTVIKKN